MNSQQLSEILIELRNASMQINLLPTENEIKSVMHKYDMLFVGEKFNIIYSLELRHSLEKYFGIKITNEELNKLIPISCASLNMKYEPMAKVEDFSNPIPYCYQIQLW